MEILNIMDRLNNALEPVKEWFFEHHDNPLLWLVCFGLGLFVFHFTFNALQKEK